MGALLIKTYVGHFAGYPQERMYFAASRGKALSRMFRDVGVVEDALTYKDFLRRASMKRCAAPQGFGNSITVSGQPAYFVETAFGSEHVRFVRPDSDVVLLYHPLDVEFPFSAECGVV